MHNTKKLTTEEFVNKAKKIHGDVYDYSKVNYVNNHTKVCIICPEHGEFWQVPNSHLSGSGCPKCAIKNNKNTRSFSVFEFIDKARKIHGCKYDYSKVQYTNNHTKVCIICPEHGEFWQTPNSHLDGKGCPGCGKLTKRKKASLNKENFIERSIAVHGGKYDYSKVEYINNHTKVCIICPEHGEFWQTPNNHLNGCGCKKCYGNNTRNRCSLNTESFVKKAIKIHGNVYDYSKVNYVNNHTKVCIICPIHGEFWQTPNSHLSKQGCPICKHSKLENTVASFLDKENILYERQKTFEWLKVKKKLRIDFFLTKYNIAIECQGRQHFVPIDYFGGKKRFNKQIKYDEIKKELCEKHGIKIIYYSNTDKKNIITNLERLKNKLYEIIS